MSKREETYCDCCGKQMSQQESGGTEVFGITLRALDWDMSRVTHQSLGLNAHYKSAVGVSSSFAKFMNKKDFCSVSCMCNAIQEWVDEVRDSIPERFQENMK